MSGRQLRFLFLLWSGLCVFAFPAQSQITQEETLSGPDSHEMSPDARAYLFGDWGGWRTRLLNRGVRFDFQYISDSLWNVESEKKKRFAMWNRFRATVDIDFGALVNQPGLYSMRQGSGRAAAISESIWVS